MRELDGDPRLVDEAADEPTLARRVRQDPLQRLDLLEPGDSDGLDLIDLGHAALRELLEDVILPETLAQRFHCVEGIMARVAGPLTDYSELEAVLGYHFKDRALLERALRHASWCNEQQASAARTTSGSSSSAMRSSTSSSAIA